MTRQVRENRGLTRMMGLIIMLTMLISIQMFSTSSLAVYSGIQFGTEAQVSTDGTNDIWQLDAGKFNYIANGQSKPEADLVGLNVTKGLSEKLWYLESEINAIDSINSTIEHNHSYSFNIPLVNLINISYAFQTNQTYVNSTIEFYNWTSAAFLNQSIVTNITTTLLDVDFYNKSMQGQEILIFFNISQAGNYTFWYNITFEVWYLADQIISLYYAALVPGNAALVDQVKSWIFLDIDADDVLDYAVRWVYGQEALLYNITPDSISSDGWWNGDLKKYWTGIEWAASTAGQTRDLGNLTTNRLNVTIPSFLVNLTAAVRYSIWSLKIEALYHWWDALPNDPNWQISVPIPSFQFILIAVGLAFLGVIFALKIKKSPLNLKTIGS